MDSCSCLESEHWRLVSTSHDSLQKILSQQVNLEKVWKNNHSKAKYRKDISSATIDTCQDHRQDSVLAGCSGALRGYGFGKKSRYRKDHKCGTFFFFRPSFDFQLSFLELKFWVLQLYRDRQKTSMWLICWTKTERYAYGMTHSQMSCPAQSGCCRFCPWLIICLMSLLKNSEGITTTPSDLPGSSELPLSSMFTDDNWRVLLVNVSWVEPPGYEM